MERRITWTLLFFYILFLAVIIRLFTMQIVHHKDYTRLAARQHRLVKELEPERGAIFARDKGGRVIALALNKTWKNVVASPKDIEDPGLAAEILGREIGLDTEELRMKLSKKEDPHEIIAKKIDPFVAESIERRALKGVFFEEEKLRIYPHGSIGAHVLGFVSKEEDKETGKYGIERRYEQALAGEDGFFEGIKDAAGFWVALGKRLLQPPKNGSKIFLTLDYNIQVRAEEVLSRVREKWGARSGEVLVLEPSTGRILALAARPAFDPNDFSKEKDFSIFLNPAVEAMYELGSVLKPITMAAAVNEGLVTSESTYQDPGLVKIKGYTIRNFDGRSYGVQTMMQILEKSLNTGAVHVAGLLGHERELNYLTRFGYGEKTGVDLPGEIAGDLSNLTAGREIDFATASFGQGIAVTPMQLAQSFGAIANAGKLMRPYIVEKTVDDSGNEVVHAPAVVREVVSLQTAETLTRMLISAVRNGFENRAGVKGYFVAGKTGTAQIPRRDGRGYSDAVIHTFVGYGPAFNPRFLIVLQLNEPKGNRFAANTLTPAFHDLAEYILNYYEIPPDEKP